MDTHDALRLVYLGILITAILGGLLYRSRHRMSQFARNAFMWVLIIGGTVVAVASFQGAGSIPFAKQASVSEGRIELAMQPNGHYHVRALVNEVPIDFIVDTGASHVVLTREDAARVGINLDELAYIGSASTANGIVRTAPVRLDSIEIEEVRDSNVRAVVNEGEMAGSLLGMSYLSRYDKIEISKGRLILTR